MRLLAGICLKAFGASTATQNKKKKSTNNQRNKLDLLLLLWRWQQLKLRHWAPLSAIGSGGGCESGRASTDITT